MDTQASLPLPPPSTAKPLPAGEATLDRTEEQLAQEWFDELLDQALDYALPTTNDVLLALVAIAALNSYGVVNVLDDDGFPSVVETHSAFPRFSPVPCDDGFLGLGGDQQEVNTLQGTIACLPDLDPDEGATELLERVKNGKTMQALRSAPLDVGFLAEGVADDNLYQSDYLRTPQGYAQLRNDLRRKMQELSQRLNLPTTFTDLYVSYLGAGGDVPTGGGQIETLGSTPSERINGAWTALALYWPQEVLPINDQNVGVVIAQAMTAIAYAASNFGLAQNGTIETNNWFLLGYQPAMTQQCDPGMVRDTGRTDRCLNVFRTMKEAVEMAVAFATQFNSQLTTKDIGKLAEALFSTQLFMGLPMTKENYSAVVTTLKGAFDEVGKAVGYPMEWRDTGYLPASLGGTAQPGGGEQPGGGQQPGGGNGQPGGIPQPGGGEQPGGGDKPTTEEPEEEKKSWWPWLLGAAAVAGVGFLLLRENSDAEGTADASNNYGYGYGDAALAASLTDSGGMGPHPARRSPRISAGWDLDHHPAGASYDR